MTEVTMVKALKEALRHSLADDPRSLVLGEDVGKLGGVFRVTDGLQAEFGDERVFDTPLAEAAIAGVSVGLCMAGWHPVAEMQFDGFSYPALDQIISHVAKYLAVVAVAAEVGTEIEVLDLRSLVPVDLEGLAGSVRKTGHAVVVHEAPMTHGMGAEIVARIVEDCFDYLEAPVLRVTGYDTTYPPANIEGHYLQSVERILDAIHRVRH